MMKKKTLIAALLGLAMASPLASVAGAQVTSATIVGTVTDASGAALPAPPSRLATWTPVSPAPCRRTMSAPIVSSSFPLGRYVVEVSLSGFKTAVRSGIVLNVNDTARVDAALSLGGVSETVNVEGAPTAIDTATSEISRTIDAVAIQSLPIVDRNVYSLLDLTPGVQSNNNGVASASAATSSLVLGYPEQRTLINGGADGGTGSVNYYLDGGINMTGLRNTGNILPNPDAIQEFKVQTNSYNADTGFSPAASSTSSRRRAPTRSTDRPSSTCATIAERQRLGLPARQAATQPQSVRRHPWRPDRAQQDLLLWLLLGIAADDQRAAEHGRGAHREPQRTGNFSASPTAPRRPGDRAGVCLQRRHGRHLP